MTFTTTIIGATLPSILLLWYFYKSDFYPEPPKVLMITFGLGVLITIPAVIWATQFDEFGPSRAGPMLMGLYTAFLCAAGPEETLKYVVLVNYSAEHKAFDEPMDGVVYGATASLGFATLENILYVAEGGWGVALIRALTAVPGHACWGAIMGYYVGQARFGGGSRKQGWYGLAVAILLHGLYDFPLLSMHHAGQLAEQGMETAAESLPVGWLIIFFLAVFLFGVVWTYRIVRRLRREQLQHSRFRRSAG